MRKDKLISFLILLFKKMKRSLFLPLSHLTRLQSFFFFVFLCKSRVKSLVYSRRKKKKWKVH